MNNTTNNYQPYLHTFQLPQPNSHKGQNGKVMIIGGSNLFHAASKWSLDIASKIVDMVFYSSVPSNNKLIHKAKEHFNNGIVVPREDIEDYIKEAGVILIGPGMERGNERKEKFESSKKHSKPTKDEWNNDTQKITNYLLHTYPHKKWVIDAGALQMVDPELLNKNMIITPHTKEFSNIMKKVKIAKNNYANLVEQSKKLQGQHTKEQTYIQSVSTTQDSERISQLLNNATTLLKGPTDVVFNTQQILLISGGNQGMTKGGTGDVLAGLIAGLYAFTDDPVSATVIGSFVNKKAADQLYKEVGIFYNASDLANKIPHVLREVLRSR